eukprot:tig00000704_g3353.t1
MSSDVVAPPTPTAPVAPIPLPEKAAPAAPIPASEEAPAPVVKKPAAAAATGSPVSKEAQDKEAKGLMAANKIELDPQSIIRWKNPAVSGTFFALINVAWYLLAIRGWTLISLVSWILFAEVAVCFLYVNLFTVISEVILKKSVKRPVSGRQVFVSPDVIRSHLDALVPVLETVENTFMNLLLGTDNRLALQGMGILLVTAVLGQFFSILNLLYFAFLAAFTLPKLYESKKTEIDRAFDNGMKKASELRAKAVEKAGDLKKQLNDRIPRGANVAIEKKKQ